MFSKLREEARKFDWLTFLLVVMLVGIGLAAIYSVELSREVPDFLNFKKQIFFVPLGIILALIFSFYDYRRLRNYSLVLSILAIVLLVLVLFFGQVVRGHKGWFVFVGFGFQPVEFAKIVFIIALAKFFSEHDMQVEPIKSTLGSAFLAALFMLPVFLEGDLGSLLILGGLWFLMLTISGLRWKYISALIGIFVIFAVFSWFFILHDYQKARVITFVNPASDPLGAGYNIKQATIAIGSGGFWGRGIGFGSQSQLRFLPESHTDFIFAVIAEEMGFVIVALLILFFVIFFYRSLKYMNWARDNFTSFLLLGIVLLFVIQDFINIGMNLGFLPVTGVPLTFVSYGGSSLLASFILVGILQSINIRNKA